MRPGEWWNSHLQPVKRCRHAFTLIELLVVISIIAVLAALLLPVLGRAKARAQGVTCLSNFKQLNLAWQMYADDNDGALVGLVIDEASKGASIPQLPWVNGILSLEPDNWDNFSTINLVDGNYAAFAPYIKRATIYKCPSDKSTALWHGANRNRVRSYQSAGGWYFGLSYLSPGGRTIPKITWAAQPGRELTFIEAHADTITSGYFPPPWRLPGEERIDYPSLAFMRDLPGSRHGGSGVVAFGDGRVEFHKWLDSRTTRSETGVDPRDPSFEFLSSLCDPVNKDALWIDSHSQLLGNPGSRQNYQ